MLLRTVPIKRAPEDDQEFGMLKLEVGAVQEGEEALVRPDGPVQKRALSD